MKATNPTRDEIEAWIDTLDRAEPHQGRGAWGEAYGRLQIALIHARKIRRYCIIPAAIAAAAFVILFHGEVWDIDDIRNLFGVEGLVLFAVYFLLTKMFAVLAHENRVQTLLRYYGAQDVPHEEEAMQ